MMIRKRTWSPWCGVAQCSVTNARCDGGKTKGVAVVVADIEDKTHEEVDVDMRQGAKRATWP